MIAVNVYKMKDIDLRSVSAFMHVKKASGEWREETAIDNVENSMNRSFGETDDIIILAEDGGELLGCVLLHLKEGNQAEINPWFLRGLPIVRQESEDFDISEKLIIRTRDYVQETGITRVEMTFPREKRSEQVKAILQHCGLILVEEIVHMRENLSGLTIDAPEVPESIEKRVLLQVSLEDLFACWSETFQHGQDRSILARSSEERRAFFNESFDFTKPLIETASLALIHNSVVIGFSLVRPTHGEKNGHIWELGISPAFRRQGLAKYLIAEAKEQLEELGFTTMSLNVDTDNRIAFNLYKAIGLQEDWCMVTYGWLDFTK